MIGERGEPLLHAWFDGVIEPAEQAELDQLLQQDSKLADRFVELAIIDYGLRASVTAHSERRRISAPASSNRVSNRKRSIASRRSRRSRRSRAAPAVMLAAVLVFIGLLVIIANLPTSTPAPQPVIVDAPEPAPPPAAPALPVEVLGPATITDAAGQMVTRREMRSGDSVVATGDVTLQWRAERTALRLEPESHCQLMEAQGAKLIELKGGTVHAEVAAQAADDGFTIRTPDGLVSVVGTAFTVQLDPAGSLVSVTEGRVQVADTRGKEALLAAGESARLPLPEPVAPPPPTPPTPADDREPTVTALALVDMVSGREVPGYEALADGTVIDRAALGLTRITLVIKTNGSVGSLRATVDGVNLADGDKGYENNPPFSVAGDNAEDGFHEWEVTPGTHTIKVTPYAEDLGAGRRGATRTWTLTIR